MSIGSALKTPVIGLLTAVAYAAFILDIIQIIKVHENQYTQTYPPAVVAMLVASLLQAIWSLGLITTSGRNFIYRASNVVGAAVFFIIFQLIPTAITAAWRHRERYCPVTASNYGDCRGVLRGVIGLGFATVGLDLFLIGAVVALVAGSVSGSWDDELYDLPARPRPNADLEKAPAH